MRRQIAGITGGLAAALAVLAVIAAPLTATGTPPPPGPAWTNPSAVAVRQVSAGAPAPGSISTGVGNIPCAPTGGFRVAGGTASGCFTMTAFGFMDPDTGQINQLDTDTLVRLRGALGNETFVPIPLGAGVVSFTPAPVDGSYMHVYPAVYGYTDETTDISTGVTTDTLTLPPTTPLRDGDGRAVPVNPQTLTFSDRDGWYVIEAPHRAFLRVNRATYDVLPFTASFTSQPLDTVLHASQIAISPDGRYVALISSESRTFRVYDLNNCTGQTDPADSLKPLTCAFHDYWPFLDGKIPGFKRVLKVDFLDDGLLSFAATDASGGGTFLLAPTERIDSLLDYLALGDSYTSGEGAYNYRTGTDTAKDMCHLSLHSYPLLLAQDVFTEASGHSAACSGAVIGDIEPHNPAGYRGQVAGGQRRDEMSETDVETTLAGFIPGYLAQAEFVSRYQPRVLTVSVGGDDIGFGTILRTCVEPQPISVPGSNTCYSTYEERKELLDLIDRTVPRLSALYTALQQRSPGSAIYVVGYPQIAYPDGNCALNVHLNHQELEFSVQLIDYLNAAVQKAAVAAGTRYIDISQALAGHRLCETTSASIAMNGLTAGNDGKILGIGVLGKESYHPNALGQELIEQAILRQTHNFRDAAPPPDTDIAALAHSLLDAPKSGRPVHNLRPDASPADPSAQRGGTLGIHASGLQPGVTYTVQLHGGEQPLGTLKSDSQGTVTGEVSLPDDTVPGDHEVEIIGGGAGGTTIAVTAPVYVSQSAGDTDGDGMADTDDSCQTVMNSGVDSDHDGTDDACDPLIAETTSPPTAGSGNGEDTTASLPSAGQDTGPTTPGDQTGVLQGGSAPSLQQSVSKSPAAARLVLGTAPAVTTALKAQQAAPLSLSGSSSSSRSLATAPPAIPPVSNPLPRPQVLQRLFLWLLLLLILAGLLWRQSRRRLRPAIAPV